MREGQAGIEADVLARGLRRLRGSPLREFHSDYYLRINQRRLEHLATLPLPLAERSVLEVGAGIGDHTSFFIDRGCTVTITDAREENLAIVGRRLPGNRRPASRPRRARHDVRRPL